ncbi:OprO/OprP family phosphate-selective porin [Dasania marina]|uniref:OprO/OprP family phosphate-selective porin n=1 Tax=Dasania marina TaxID=471499 RepID=UPI0004AD1CF8|nr:porin [Dasania marina]
MEIYKKISSINSGLLVFSVAMTSVAAVQADELKTIREAITVQERQLDSLKLRLERLETANSRADGRIEETLILPSNNTAISWGNPAPKFSAKPEGFTFKSRGKLQADAMYADDDYGSGTEIRRVRLGVQGDISGSTDYVAEIDFSNKKVGFEDIFIRYKLSEVTSIRVGHHEASVSLDDETSDSNHSFLERSLHNALSLGRSVGIGLETQGTWWSLNTGLFGKPESDTTAGQNEGWRFASRLLVTPWQNDQQTLHMGVAAYYVELDDDGDYRLSSQPENHQLAALFDTGTHSANDISYTGLETAYQYNNVLLQAELGQQTVDYMNLPDASFVSGYLQAAWIITGEQRSYQRGRGKFGGIVPTNGVEAGGLGALEMALRGSYMDLVDGDIYGGKGHVYTLGLNWYPRAQLRVSANLIHFDVSESIAVQPQGSTDHSGNSLVLRSQLSW